MRRSVRAAAVFLAALAAVPLHVFADQPGTRRAWLTLSAERSGWGEEKAEAARNLSPAGVPGAEIGWFKSRDLRPDTGLQLDLAQSWALHADWDRHHRPKMSQVRDTIDTFLLGVQYRFR